MIRGFFNHKFLAFLMSVTLVLTASGCIYLAVGALGVVGGYVVSPDTVEGTANNSFEEVFDAAKEITTIMGQVNQENANMGQLVATINGTRVEVTLSAVNVSTTKLRIKARKSFMPKIDTAQDVYTKIIKQLGS